VNTHQLDDFAGHWSAGWLTRLSARHLAVPGSDRFFVFGPIYGVIGGNQDMQ
jgi:hypothetical protein